MTQASGTSSGERAATRRPSTGRDGGFSFVEVVVSIVLIGIVVIGILGAVRANIIASSIALNAAEVETVLLNAADRVDRATIRDCDYANEVAAAAPDPEWSVVIVEHERLVATPSGSEDSDWGACSLPLGAFDVERVVIRATEPSGEISRTMTVVKSDVD